MTRPASDLPPTTTPAPREPSRVPLNERLTWRIADLAAALSISRRLLERERSAGRFPAPDLHVGKTPLWRPETVRAWLSREGGGRVATTSKTPAPSRNGQKAATRYLIITPDGADLAAIAEQLGDEARVRWARDVAKSGVAELQQDASGDVLALLPADVPPEAHESVCQALAAVCEAGGEGRLRTVPDWDGAGPLPVPPQLTSQPTVYLTALIEQLPGPAVPRMVSCNVDLDLRLLKIPRTDTGNAERLVARHSRDLRFCHAWGKWLVWDGRRWAEDATAEIWRRATATARDIMLEASVSEDRDERLAHAKWSHSSENQNRLNAMLKVAETRLGVPVLVEELDRDPWLFNCRNGTLDLRTGELRPHRREDLITKMCDVDFDPEAAAPLWFETLRLFFRDDPDLLDYWNRLCGCFVVGTVRDHILPICYGSGANGKSTILGSLLETFGPDYSMKAPSDLLLARKHDAHPTERADLYGKRLVMSLESDKGRRLNEGLVKGLTGGDQVEARRMYEDFWRFNPSHTFVLATNHKPIVRGTDHGIWRRIKLIPFTVRVEGDRADTSMPEKLKAERAGILAYCVEGCLEWQRRGLEPPPACVVLATAEYRGEQDVLGQFLAEYTMPGGSVKASTLFKVFREWAGDSGERGMTSTSFGLALSERGFEKIRRKGGLFYLGVQLAANHAGEGGECANG